jgi:hypothetical protein
VEAAVVNVSVDCKHGVNMMEHCSRCALEEKQMELDWHARDEAAEDEWYEERMDRIGQNGNNGEHYDQVNHPSHYTSGDIECIAAIKAALTPEEFRGYCKGNNLKYTWRERHKGGNESLLKGVWYISQLTGGE